MQCSLKCLFAKGSDCDCPCGGVGHQMGLAQDLTKTGKLAPRNRKGHYMKLNTSQKIRAAIANGATIGQAARAVGVSYHHARSVAKPWRKPVAQAEAVAA